MARDELVALGLSPRAVDRRVKAGRLHVLHRGVYAVGHRALTWHAHGHAALLAVGEESGLSHASAAIAYRMARNEGPAFEVTVRGRTPRSRPGLKVHTSSMLEIRIVDGLRVTTPARTLLDLAAREDITRPLAEAQVLRIVTIAALRAELRRHPTHHGVASLARALDTTEPTRSELERRLAELIRRAGLPRPRFNAALGPYEVDVLWERERVVVETDGWAAHRTPRGLRARSGQGRASAGTRVRGAAFHLAPGARRAAARRHPDRAGPGRSLACAPCRRSSRCPATASAPRSSAPPRACSTRSGDFEYEEHVFGGASIDAHGSALTDETLDACRRADAVLLAAVGGPKWDTTDPDAPRPEQGLLGLRKGLGLYANLRPGPAAARALRRQPAQARDHRAHRPARRARAHRRHLLRREDAQRDRARDECLLRRDEIERIARIAFERRAQRA